MKPVLGFVISLDLGVLSGLSLCLHVHLGSALVRKKIYIKRVLVGISNIKLSVGCFFFFVTLNWRT